MSGHHDPQRDAWYRPLQLDQSARGRRLDRFLALRFASVSRSAWARELKSGRITNAEGLPLRASTTLRGTETLRIYTPGIAPSGPPPAMTEILLDDRGVIALEKPPGLAVHPTGDRFAWSVIDVARRHWPDRRLDLVHRLDRDTSGIVLLTDDPALNAHLKASMRSGAVRKWYLALARGRVKPSVVTGPIGPATGPIRIQMAVREDGLSARTEIEVLETRSGPPELTLVRCRIHTGRTHQIRVHLAHVAHGIVGDRMYGVPPEVFLTAWEEGVDARVITAAGAPRHALHATRIEAPHPAGGTLIVESPLPDDMARWWDHPEVLPLDDHQKP